MSHPRPVPVRGAGRADIHVELKARGYAAVVVVDGVQDIPARDCDVVRTLEQVDLHEIVSMLYDAQAPADAALAADG
jgi:hypothetical protein